MSRRWLAVRVSSIADDAYNSDLLANSGTTVLYSDDLEWAADNLKINVEDIELIDEVKSRSVTKVTSDDGVYHIINED